MFKTLIAATVAVAAVSAASWPMVTVNSAGNIVLNSPTKAGSFQLNAVTATSGPTSATTASRSTVTVLDADTDAFIVSVPTSPATSAGYKLPAATEGRTIRFYNSGSGKGAFTIWTASTSVTFDGTSATTMDIASTTSYVVATATSSTNWVVTQNAASSGLINKGYATASTVTLSSNAATLTAANVAGAILTVTPTAASTLTTPTATDLTAFDAGSADGDSYSFTVTNAGTEAVATDIGLTLTAGTGVTVPTDGTQVIVPGQTATFQAYRTGSAAWTFMRLFQTTKLPAAAVNTPTAAIATGAQAETAHALHFNFQKVTAGKKGVASVITVTNNYAKAGDACIPNGPAATGTSDVLLKCTVTADNTVTVTTVGGFVADSGTADNIAFTVLKR